MNELVNERKGANDWKTELTNIWNEICAQASDVGWSKTSRPCSKLESAYVRCANEFLCSGYKCIFSCLLDADISTDRSIDIDGIESK